MVTLMRMSKVPLGYCFLKAATARGRPAWMSLSCWSNSGREGSRALASARERTSSRVFWALDTSAPTLTGLGLAIRGPVMVSSRPPRWKVNVTFSPTLEVPRTDCRSTRFLVMRPLMDRMRSPTSRPRTWPVAPGTSSATGSPGCVAKFGADSSKRRPRNGFGSTATIAGAVPAAPTAGVGAGAGAGAGAVSAARQRADRQGRSRRERMGITGW